MATAFFEPLESRRLASVSPIPGNWDLNWSDEFNSRPTTPTWVDTLWGTTHFEGEIQNYTPNNVTVSNGLLNLTAKKETSNGFPYTSGLIDTGGDFATGGNNLPGFSFKYGYVEARMKLTKGSGLWPAFWMMPTPDANGNYHDSDGEIDIMEQVGTDPTRTEAHLHHDTDFGKSYNTGVDLSAGFHTYGLDWQSDHLTWYFDGTPYYTVTSQVPNVEMYLIFNLAIGDANSWPGAPDASTVFPATMQVDYVRVYKPASSQAPPPIPGDTNIDGAVNVTDLGNMASNYGVTSGATWADGDFNGDGRVDVTDLGNLASNFGMTGSSAAVSMTAAPQALVTATTTPADSTAAKPSAASNAGLTSDSLRSPATSLVTSRFSGVRIVSE